MPYFNFHGIAESGGMINLITGDSDLGFLDFSLNQLFDCLLKDEKVAFVSSRLNKGDIIVRLIIEQFKYSGEDVPEENIIAKIISQNNEITDINEHLVRSVKASHRLILKMLRGSLIFSIKDYVEAFESLMPTRKFSMLIFDNVSEFEVNTLIVKAHLRQRYNIKTVLFVNEEVISGITVHNMKMCDFAIRIENKNKKRNFVPIKNIL